MFLRGLILIFTSVAVLLQGGCTSLYQAYDAAYDREVQMEASTDGTGTVRYVIKPRAKINLYQTHGMGQAGLPRAGAPARSGDGKSIVAPADRGQRDFRLPHYDAPPVPLPREVML